MSVLAKRVSRLHKIIGVVAGLQILFWTVSGLFFTLFPMETIRGDLWRPVIEHGSLADMSVTLSAEDVVQQAGSDISSLELKPFLGAPVWLVESRAGRQMIDARTGDVRSPLSQTDIDRLVDRFDDRPSGLGSLTVTYLIHENPLREYGGPLPTWVLEYEPQKQRIYVDAVTGDIRAVRTTKWRIFDVLWRFHIMDITGEDRFDTWWIKLFAFLGLTMVLSGFVILVDRARKGRLFG